MNKKLIGLAFLMCTVTSGALMAKAAAPGDLTTFIEKGMQDWHVPGAAVAVVTDKEVLFEKGFGNTATKDGTPVDTHTLFAIASTTDF